MHSIDVTGVEKIKNRNRKLVHDFFKYYCFTKVSGCTR
jgi:hypothetical protein